MVKNISILGSTGSIGNQTIDVAQKLGINVVALSAYKNIDALIFQTKMLNPDMICIVDERYYKELKELFPDKIILTGQKGLLEVARYSSADLVVNALVGISGLAPTIEAIKANKDVALANKETLVVGGKIIRNILSKYDSQLIPVDSEHSAIYQCLMGEAVDSISKIILTASGGPFRGKKLCELKEVTIDDVLAHPTWSMGKKITVDSATLINKGFEIIEAMYFFDVDFDMVDVVIHPQSIIHSMVEFIDGSIKAQMSVPDMRLPIELSLSYPRRSNRIIERLDFAKLSKLEFEQPDYETFKLLGLAYECAKEKESYPVVLNATNEEAVKYFLERRISFVDIMNFVEEVLQRHEKVEIHHIDDIFEVDFWARNEFKKIAGR